MLLVQCTKTGVPSMGCVCEYCLLRADMQQMITLIIFDEHEYTIFSNESRND